MSSRCRKCPFECCIDSILCFLHQGNHIVNLGHFSNPWKVSVYLKDSSGVPLKGIICELYGYMGLPVLQMQIDISWLVPNGLPPPKLPSVIYFYWIIKAKMYIGTAQDELGSLGPIREGDAHWLVFSYLPTWLNTNSEILTLPQGMPLTHSGMKDHCSSMLLGHHPPCTINNTAISICDSIWETFHLISSGAQVWCYLCNPLWPCQWSC